VRWGCGYIGTLPRGANWLSPETKYKRSRIARTITSIALSLTNLEFKLLMLTAHCPMGESRYPHFCQFSTIFDFSEKNPKFWVVCKKSEQGSFAEIVSVLLACFSQLGWKDLIPFLFSWYKTYRSSLLASTCKSNTADSGKRWIELDPDVCERRGACGFLDLYMQCWFRSA